jgi:hypothetical protein
MSRWYDRFKHINALVNVCQELPVPVQENIGRKLKGCASFYKMRNVGQDQEFKSLGRDLIISLYMSKRRRRWYDHHYSLHEALNNIRIAMPEEALRKLNERCGMVLKRINAIRYDNPRDLHRQAQVMNSFLNATPMIEIREQSGHLNPHIFD